MYIEEYFAGQHREDQNYFIIYWNYLNNTQRIKNLLVYRSTLRKELENEVS